MLCVGTDAETSRLSLDLAVRFDEVWAGAAIHPSASKGWEPRWADEIDGLLEHPRVRAVGETGLDFHWDTSFLDDQKAMFSAHVELSKKHDKALVIHTRDSVDAALEILERHRPPDRLVFHCWSGDRGQMERALRIGAYISFAGNVSFNKNHALRELARLVPEDRVLVETDTPYLTPVPYRGEPNEPAYVRFVGQAVAAARSVAPDQLAAATTSNARRLLGIA